MKELSGDYSCAWCRKPVTPEDQSDAITDVDMHKWCFEPWFAKYGDEPDKPSSPVD